MIRYVVLGLLRNGEKLHGYALVTAHRRLIGAQLNSGNLYRELARLAAEGLVRPVARSARGAEADPRRMQYEITDSGTAELEAWLAVLPETVASQGTDDLALRAHFVAQIEPAAGASCSSVGAPGSARRVP